MDPSKPNDPNVDRGQPIPRSRPGNEEVLEGEVIDRGVPIGRPHTAPPPPAPTPKKPGNFRRILLLAIISTAAIVCLGGSLTFYVLYDKATTPERGTPAVTLEQYVTAKFGQRDESRVQLFVCDSPNLESVDSLLSQIIDRESQTKVGIQVTLADVSVVQESSSATIQANLDIAAAQGGGATSVVRQRWEFTLRESDGWRVCTATKLS